MRTNRKSESCHQDSGICRTKIASQYSVEASWYFSCVGDRPADGGAVPIEIAHLVPGTANSASQALIRILMETRIVSDPLPKMLSLLGSHTKSHGQAMVRGKAVIERSGPCQDVRRGNFCATFWRDQGTITTVTEQD